MLAVRALISIAALPGLALGLVPFWLLSWEENRVLAGGVGRPAEPLFWLGLVTLLMGLSLLGWTIALFFRRGRGTLAPWDPPKRLVIDGPYRFVRNPMITGVMLGLLGQALLFESVVLAMWCAAFFAVSAIHFPLVEEPGLRLRFGQDYVDYCANVPRWIPRLKPWDPPLA